MVDEIGIVNAKINGVDQQLRTSGLTPEQKQKLEKEKDDLNKQKLDLEIRKAFNKISDKLPPTEIKTKMIQSPPAPQFKSSPAKNSLSKFNDKDEPKK